MSRVRGVAVVGTGIIYRDHATALETMAHRARLIGVAELDPSKRAAASHGTFVPVATSDYRELLDRADVELVAVCTPPSTHERIVIDALAAGKYVICEKPLAHTLAAADRILETARAYPDRLGTVYQLRYLPEIRQMVRLRDEGSLGRLLFGNFQRFGFLQSTEQSRIGWWGAWEVAGGGVVATQFIHLLDLMLHLFGKPVELRAWMATLRNPIQSEDSFTATVQFESGAVVSAVATLAAQHSLMMSLDLFGEKVSVHYPWNLRGLDRRALERARSTGGRTMQRERVAGHAARAVRLGRRLATRFLGSRPAAPAPNPHAAYYAAVLDAMDGGTPLPVPPAEARDSVELFAAIYESALFDRRVVLPLARSSRVYDGLTARDYDGARRVEPPVAVAVPGPGR